MSHILIFGATRNSGLHIANEALQRGYKISTLTRPNSDTKTLKSLNVTIAYGDAFSLKDCEDIFHQCQPQYVISTLGGKDQNGRRIDAIGNINVMRAAYFYTSQLKRFILISSMGSGEQYETISEEVKTFLGEALRAKTEAEEYLKCSPLPWTIIRPGGLNHETPKNLYQITEGYPISKAQYIARQDLALATLDVLEDTNYLRRVINIHG